MKLHFVEKNRIFLLKITFKKVPSTWCNIIFAQFMRIHRGIKVIIEISLITSKSDLKDRLIFYQ